METFKEKELAKVRFGNLGGYQILGVTAISRIMINYLHIKIPGW